jgi:hypothetical protein
MPFGRAVSSGPDFGPSREPGNALIVGLLAGFVIVWTACLSIGNAPFPILHDMSEAYVWGREFQLGYNQHPPFWAWVCGAWFLALPRAGWAFAALGALNAAIGLGGAWLLIGDFARGAKRWAAFALLLLTPFYTFDCYKFDANTIFLSIWPWTLHFFYSSLRDRRPGAAIGFGVCIGLALMSKYYALILLATCGLGAIQTPFFAKYIRSAAPWLSASIAAAICAPHVFWLLTHEAPPLRYLALVSGRGFGQIVGAAAATGLSSVVSVLPVLAIVAWFARGASPEGRGAADPNLPLIATFALAPLALTLIAGLGLRTRLTPEMPIGTFSLVPLMIIEALGSRGLDRLSWAAGRLAAGLLLVLLAASPFIMFGRLWLWDHSDTVAPHQEIAVEATKLWREKTGMPLSYVAGHGYEDAVVFYSPDRAHGFFDFDLSRNLWVTPDRLAEYGLMTVCLKDDAACLASTAKYLTPRASQTEIAVAHEFWRHVAKTYAFIVTVVPPLGCDRDPNQPGGACGAMVR